MMQNQNKALGVIAFTLGGLLGLMMTVDYFIGRGIDPSSCVLVLIMLFVGPYFYIAARSTCDQKADVEIERKFLVSEGFRKHIKKTHVIRQGYLCDDPARTVRVRTMDKKAYLTIKGAGNESGTSRFEFEIRIPYAAALKLAEICLPGHVVKNRHIVKVGKHTFEIDEFQGANEGLIIAEIELVTEDEVFERPDWLLAEVTGDKRYYNSALLKTPFKEWPKDDQAASAV